MLGSEERMINGAAYTTTRFAARRAIALGTRLAKLVAPAIGGLGGGVKIKDGKIADVSSDLIPVAINALASQLHEDSIVQLILDLLAQTTRVNPDTRKREDVGTGEIFDNIYAGNLGEMLGALKFAVEVNLSSFFAGSGISGLLQRAAAMTDRLAPADA